MPAHSKFNFTPAFANFQNGSFATNVKNAAVLWSSLGEFRIAWDGTIGPLIEEDLTSTIDYAILTTLTVDVLEADAIITHTRKSPGTLTYLYRASDERNEEQSGMSQHSRLRLGSVEIIGWRVEVSGGTSTKTAFAAIWAADVKPRPALARASIPAWPFRMRHERHPPLSSLIRGGNSF